MLRYVLLPIPQSASSALAISCSKFLPNASRFVVLSLVTLSVRKRVIIFFVSFNWFLVLGISEQSIVKVVQRIWL